MRHFELCCGVGFSWNGLSKIQRAAQEYQWQFPYCMTIFCLSFTQRSYDEKLFADAVSRMMKANIKSSMELQQFTNLGLRVNGLLASKNQDEMDFSEAPDEFRGKSTTSVGIEAIFVASLWKPPTAI